MGEEEGDKESDAPHGRRAFRKRIGPTMDLALRANTSITNCARLRANDGLLCVAPTFCSYPKVAISEHFTINQAETFIEAQSLI
jgi:hypothetical protein